MKPINTMTAYELDDLEEQIAQRRRALAAQIITDRGLHAVSERNGNVFDYVLVYSPTIEDLPNVWATVAECRHLEDFLANLEPSEAFRRWRKTVTDKYPSQPYTRADAIADTKAYRRDLDYRLAAGEIDGRQYNELYVMGKFTDLAK